MPVVVINRIEVTPGYEAEFEERFRHRLGLVDTMPGFISFELLRQKDSPVYLVVTRWERFQDFENWTRSPEFIKGHQQARTGPIITRGNVMEVYEVVDLSPTNEHPKV